MPRLGVMPPSSRLAQSSTRVAPAVRAARTPSNESTQISKIKMFLPFQHSSSCQADYLTLVDRTVSCHNNLEALHRIIHVFSEIEVVPDRLQQITLFAFAEIVMVWLVLHVDAL